MDHIRIDEGVKRGPRKKSGPKPSSPRRNNGQFLEKLPNDAESIRSALEEYQQGATLQQLADKHAVTAQAIYGWLLGELGGEQHSALVTKSLTARIASADGRLDLADNPLDLARAREQCRNTRMDLERRRSALYGQKQEITHNVAPILTINVAALPALIGQSSTVCAPQLTQSNTTEAEITPK